MSQGKTGNRTSNDAALLQQERMHPYRSVLFFALVGSSILFLSMVIMFIIWVSHHPPIDNFQLPKTFIISTLVLLFSSYFITFIQRYYKEDNARALLLSLTGALVLSGFFSILQVSSWKTLYDNGFYMDGEIGMTFLYAITGLHFVHVGGGMIYLFYLWLKAFDIWNDPVRSLLYFSNKYEAVRLELFSTYWHYLDGVWLFLFLTFLFTF